MARDGGYQRLNEGETDYRPRRRGLGIRDAIKRRTAATPESDAFGQLFFRAIVKVAPLTKFAPTDWLIKKVAMMGGTHNTKGFSIPLHVEGFEGPSAGGGGTASNPSVGGVEVASDPAPADFAPAGHVEHIELKRSVMRDVRPAHPPVEMMKDAVRRASYRAIMRECLCRKIQGCTDYPIDLGCLFIGPAARACVERGIAREATLEECLAHIDRAQAAGLSAGAYFVEVEEYVWGFRDQDMPNFLEFCFCCPCCCSATLFEQRAGGELKRILHQGIGWSCTVDEEACIGCGACAEACPHGRMSVVDGKARPHAECAGCGQCLKACGRGALSVCQTGETKPRIEDYFEKLHASV